MFVEVYSYVLGFNLSLIGNMTAINTFGKLISWQIERAHIFKPAEESIEREAPDAQPSQTNRLIADNNVESCEDLGSETDVSNTIDLKVYLFTRRWSNNLDIYKDNFGWLFFILDEQDNMISHLDILKIFCPSVENGSGSKKRSPGTISSTILDREKQENHQPENVRTYSLWNVYFSSLS